MAEISEQPNIQFNSLSHMAETPRISVMPKLGPHKPRPKKPPAQWNSNFIKEWRIFRGMTVEQLAEAAAMSTGNISALENRRQGYSAKGLEKLAKALRTTSDALLKVNPSAEGTGSFWPLWERAGPKERETLTIMAERLVEPAPKK